MNKLLQIQFKLLDKIAAYEHCDIDRDYPLHWERIHLASCARIGRFLAEKRGVDPELAAIACSLHDFGRIVTGKQAGHAVNGYEPVKAFLAASGLFTADEAEQLALAAKHHSSKKEIGTPLEEIVKDADVYDCYQYGQPLQREEQRERLKNFLAEMGL